MSSLNFSPDGTVLATGSYYENMTKLWDTKTWQLQGDPIECGYIVTCVRYSPSGELLAIETTENIQICNSISEPVRKVEDYISRYIVHNHKNWHNSAIDHHIVIRKGDSLIFLQNLMIGTRPSNSQSK